MILFIIVILQFGKIDTDSPVLIRLTPESACSAFAGANASSRRLETNNFTEQLYDPHLYKIDLEKGTIEDSVCEVVPVKVVPLGDKK